MYKHFLISNILFSPFSLPKQDEQEIESKAIKSLSIPFEEISIPNCPICKPPAKTEFFDKIRSYFSDRPIWLKNVLIQSLPEGQLISKNHLKQ